MKLIEFQMPCQIRLHYRRLFGFCRESRDRTKSPKQMWFHHRIILKFQNIFRWQIVDRLMKIHEPASVFFFSFFLSYFSFSFSLFIFILHINLFGIFLILPQSFGFLVSSKFPSYFFSLLFPINFPLRLFILLPCLFFL